MPYRPRDIYRGRRKYRVPLTIALFVLAFLLIGGITAFYVLQQYIVYDQSGVTLQLPSMREETLTAQATATPKPTFEPVAVEIIYEEPDFTQIDLGGWEELSATKTRFVPYEDVVDAAVLATTVAGAADGGYTGVVLELKTEKGQLAWASTCEMAVSYGTSGTMDYSELVASLHEQGLTAAAQISCCADELLSTRNWLVALQSASGSAYVDDDGVYWLDPYNRDVRAYLADLMAELSAMGFDEIILTNLYHPVDEGGFQYSTAIQTTPNPVTAVCQMGRSLVQSLEGTDTVVSAMLDADSLQNGNGVSTGQDVGIFWRLFARLYCPVSSDNAASVMELVSESMTGGDAGVRFVPVSAAAPEGFASYCIR